MKKLLLSILALCALTLVTSDVQAGKNNGDGKYQRVEHACGDCRMPKQHCKCSREVCEKVVPAVETAPLKEVCTDESYCEENTTARTNAHGEMECYKVIAREEVVKPICKRTCSKVCPPDYKEVTVASGHGHKVHDKQPAKRVKKAAPAA